MCDTELEKNERFFNAGSEKSFFHIFFYFLKTVSGAEWPALWLFSMLYSTFIAIGNLYFCTRRKNRKSGWEKCRLHKHFEIFQHRTAARIGNEDEKRELFEKEKINFDVGPRGHFSLRLNWIKGLWISKNYLNSSFIWLWILILKPDSRVGLSKTNFNLWYIEYLINDSNYRIMFSKKKLLINYIHCHWYDG